ncbi:uncharacterized protein LOC100002196 isoform 1 [Danio rerio]|uniref:Si:ch211-235e9.8 n=1 Tax=Danio rerio TaxID=7955 RepID=A0A0R4IGB5_DANRE|nr:uncharacterized protein LOC100002196 isoform 1 [Danio rerio]|eukprot:NP_001314974.1 protein MGARP isoform 1 [Danio rerio]
MFACRAAWQRCGPLARQSLSRAPLGRDVTPRRLMSSVPGGSGENIVYVVLCGGAFVGAVTYAYRTVTADQQRYIDRVSEISARPRSEWKPKPWPPKSEGNGDEESTVEEAEVESAVEADNSAEVLLETEEKSGALESVVEEVAETVAETAELVAEVAGVVEETAQEVAAVAQEVQKVAEEVEAAAEAIVTPVIQEEEPAAESNGTPSVSQEEAVDQAADTEA